MTGLCGAAKRSGGTCGRPAGWGTSHPGYGTCKLHLGSVGTHLVHAESLQLADEESKVAAEYGFGREVSVPDALMEALHAAAGRLDFWNAKVRQLSDLTERGQAGSVDVHHYVRAAERAERDFAKVASDCGRLGVEAWRVRLGEMAGVQLAESGEQLIARLVAALGADDGQALLVRGEVAGWLRQLSAGDVLQVTA